MIYLCRHGQTVFNAARRYQGQVDSPLTALGQAQAQTLAVPQDGIYGIEGGKLRLVAS